MKPFLIPNTPHFNLDFIKYHLKGVILSGGNDLIEVGGDAPERDDMEQSLLKYCPEHHIPVLGVCRGMQLGGVFYRGKLEKIPNHTGTRHSISWQNAKREVNSYHNYGFLRVPDCFEILAKAEDNIIESIHHKSESFLGIMWHPEREVKPDPLDVQLFKGHFHL